MSEPEERREGADDERDEAPEPDLEITAHDEREAIQHLRALEWPSAGLTRDEIRRKYHTMPKGLYLRLPSSKRYHSPAEVFHDAEIAPSRAEGDFVGAHPDIPEAESVSDGGPPAWGGTPLFHVDGVEDGGSAEDRDPDEVDGE
jgi:hypothetical protein